MPRKDQVGRPCTHWSLRRVVSISRSSAFISGTLEAAIGAHGLVTGHRAERALEHALAARHAVLAEAGEEIAHQRRWLGGREQRRQRADHELRRARRA